MSFPRERFGLFVSYVTMWCAAENLTLNLCSPLLRKKRMQQRLRQRTREHAADCWSPGSELRSRHSRQSKETPQVGGGSARGRGLRHLSWRVSVARQTDADAWKRRILGNLQLAAMLWSWNVEQNVNVEGLARPKIKERKINKTGLHLFRVFAITSRSKLYFIFPNKDATWHDGKVFLGTVTGVFCVFQTILFTLWWVMSLWWVI